MKIQEKLFFLNNIRYDYTIFVADYAPLFPMSAPSTFIIFNPLGAERNVMDAVLVNLSRELAGLGNRIIRFDYFGTGDSDGDFEDITLRTLTSDIETILQYLDNVWVDKIGFIGVRFGALFAMYLAEKHFLNYLILCAPIISASEYFDAELMQVLSMQTVLFKKILWDRKRIKDELSNGNSTIINGYNLANLNGFPLSKKMYDSLIKLDSIPNSISNLSAKTLIINIVNRKRKRYKNIEVLRERYKNVAIEVVDIFSEGGLPWIHGKRLTKIYYPLNKAIVTWLK